MGNASLRSFIDTNLISSIINSVSTGFVSIVIMFAFIFGSIRWAILGILPNIVPLLFIGGVMGFFKVPVESTLSMLVCITMGIAVDDTIYFLANYNRLTRSGISSYDAVFDIFQNTGSALIWTTVTLVVGFGCFLFGSFIPNVHFGVMTAIILGFALILDLVLTPAILLLKDNRKK